MIQIKLINILYREDKIDLIKKLMHIFYLTKVTNLAETIYYSYQAK